MPKKGHKWTKDQKEKRSQSYSGEGNPFYGKTHTEQTRQTIGKFKKGKWNGVGFKKGMIPWNKGKSFSLEVRKKISENTKIAMARPEIREKMEKTWFRLRECPWNYKGGISTKEYKKALKEKEAGRIKPEICEICGDKGRIHFDHDHKTGKFRGWICANCNHALGFVKDNPKVLILLSEYLKKHGR